MLRRPSGERADADGALPSLTALFLQNNRIGPSGTEAFAAAAIEGGLPALTELWLNANNVGAAGVRAPVRAFRRGAGPDLMSLVLRGTGVSAQVQRMAHHNVERLTKARHRVTKMSLLTRDT